MSLFTRKKPPHKTFAHASDCKILAADPGVEILWNEIEAGVWSAECVCGREYFRDTPDDQRVRLDPLDPKTSRHLPQCEHRDTTDPGMLKMLLKVRDGAGGGYWWVECGSCEAGWQVPHHAAASVG